MTAAAGRQPSFVVVEGFLLLARPEVAALFDAVIWVDLPKEEVLLPPDTLNQHDQP